MQRLALRRVLPLVGVLLCAATGSTAENRSTTDEAAKAVVLVRQFGADSFEAREAAYAQVEKLGQVAQKALEEGVKSEDLEISSRSKRLLALVTRSEVEVALDAFLADKDTKLILKLPAWERFKKVVGEDSKARSMFVEMYTTEGNLLASLDHEPSKFEKAFNERCQQIQQNLYTPWGQVNQISMGQVLALLFAATDARAKTSVNSFYMMTNLLYQQNIQQSFRSSAGARKLLAQFFDRHMDQNTMAQAIQLAMQLDMKEMAPAALKAATNKNGQQWTRATALLAVGKLGTKDQIKDIEPLLEDKTQLGTMRFNQTQVETQMRDVALAAMIMLSGQNVKDYDFPYLKLIQLQQNQNLSYNYFGFSDNKQREASLTRFKESQSKESNKDEKKEKK